MELEIIFIQYIRRTSVLTVRGDLWNWKGNGDEVVEWELQEEMDTGLELEKQEVCDKKLVVMLLPGPQSSRVSTGRKC